MPPLVGEVFRPWKRFNGVMIPDPVLASDLSPGEKLCYGLLARFQGKAGECYPSMRTIGNRMGITSRQAFSYVGGLKRKRYIEQTRRGRGRSNSYVFLWHPTFDAAERKHSSDPTGTSLPPKRITDGEGLDLDSSPSNRKPRDPTASQLPESQPRQYPDLREALCEYMMADEHDERVYPSDRHVVDVMDAAGGATESEVIECLRYLQFERGLACGKRNSPRTFAWFKTVVHDYFTQRRNRDQVTMPAGYTDWLSKVELERMGAAFDPASD